MTPISLGIFASAANVAATSFESIATINAGGSSQVSFTNIPQTYTHLQLRGIFRSTDSRSNVFRVNIVFRMNGANIRGAIYSFHQLYGNGSVAGGYGDFSQQEAYVSYVPTANVASNVFGATVIDILDYSNTNKYKTFRGISGFDDNSTNGGINLFSMLQQETAAISSIYLSNDYNNAWTTGTQFALYGIKGPA